MATINRSNQPTRMTGDDEHVVADRTAALRPPSSMAWRRQLLQQSSVGGPSGFCSLMPSATGQAVVVHIKLNAARMEWDDEFPPGLEPVLFRNEFGGIMQFLNRELNQDALANRRRLKRWVIVMAATMVVGIGLAVSPYVWYLLHCREMIMATYWERMARLFWRLNRRTYYRRNLEWRLVEDDDATDQRRDAVNHLFAYQIEITWKQRILDVEGSTVDDNVPLEQSIAGSLSFHQRGRLMDRSARAVAGTGTPVDAAGSTAAEGVRRRWSRPQLRYSRDREYGDAYSIFR